jgi:hypothetical protein
VRVTATGTFTLAGGGDASATRTFTLRR